MPYDFPSGEKLKTNVIDALAHSSDGSLFNHLEKMNVSPETMHYFKTELEKDKQRSVDAFLETRAPTDGGQRMEFIGKLAMAGILLPIEHAQDFSKYGQCGEDWYSYLYGKMIRPNKEAFAWNRLSIITFNYDRSLEKFFMVALSGSYGISDEEAAGLLSAIPIIHVHGQLGRLPERALILQVPPAADAEQSELPYGSQLSSDVLHAAAKNIEVIHTQAAPSKAFTAARKAIDNANKIVFLGFAYHDENLKRLGMFPFDNTNGKLIQGSTHGLTQLESKRIIQKIKGNCRLDTDGEGSSKCLDYLRQKVDLV